MPVVAMRRARLLPAPRAVEPASFPALDRWATARIARLLRSRGAGRSGMRTWGKSSVSLMPPPRKTRLRAPIDSATLFAGSGAVPAARAAERCSNSARNTAPPQSSVRLPQSTTQHEKRLQESGACSGPVRGYTDLEGAMRVNRTRRQGEHSGFSGFTLWPTKWQPSASTARITPSPALSYFYAAAAASQLDARRIPADR